MARHKKGKKQKRREAERYWLNFNRSEDLPGERRANSNPQRPAKPKRNNRNRHHLLNKCRGGSMMSENLVWMDIQKHNLLHKIFRNDDPEYIILALDRLMDAKGYHRFRGVRVVRNPIQREDAA
jgi:hypothetical protein